jgi:hypothetical protein
MKTKIIALFAILALAFVGLNTTSCSKDDDDSSSSTSDSASLGKTDGTAFANAYATYKAKGYTSFDENHLLYPTITVDGISAIDTMLKYGTKYRNSNDKAYKEGFIAAASGATGPGCPLTNLLESESETDLLKLLNATTSSARVGSDI